VNNAAFFLGFQNLMKGNSLISVPSLKSAFTSIPIYEYGVT